MPCYSRNVQFFIYSQNIILNSQATEDAKELHKTATDKTKLKVADEEIDNISLSNLGFVYDGKGN